MFYVAGVVGLLIMLTVTLGEAVGRPGSLDLLVGAVLLALHDRRGLAYRGKDSTGLQFNSTNHLHIVWK